MTEINQAENPVADADFEAIDRLFNKDPQFLTEDDMTIIVAKLRSGRGRWLHETEKKAVAKKKLDKQDSKDLLSALNITF